MKSKKGSGKKVDLTFCVKFRENVWCVSEFGLRFQSKSHVDLNSILFFLSFSLFFVFRDRFASFYFTLFLLSHSTRVSRRCIHTKAYN